MQGVAATRVCCRVLQPCTEGWCCRVLQRHECVAGCCSHVGVETAFHKAHTQIDSRKVVRAHKHTRTAHADTHIYIQKLTHTYAHLEHIENEEGIRMVLQCDAVCCSVMQCVAVCCLLLQCVTVSSSGLYLEHIQNWRASVWRCSVMQGGALCCSVLRCVAVCCIVLYLEHVENVAGIYMAL